jgi:putative addiction module component (TIGR02574 family)
MADTARLENLETEALSRPEVREPDVEAAWADEAERRFDELESGAVEAIPSEQVFEEARSRLV